MAGFGIFKKAKQSLLEQLDTEVLAPDKDTMTRIKKKLTHGSTVAHEYLDKKKALQDELGAIDEAKDPLTNGVKLDAGLEGFNASVSAFLSHKYQKRTKEEVTEELDLLEKWAKQYFSTFLTDILADVRAVKQAQQSKINEVQDTLETYVNTMEVDEVVSVIAGEYPEILSKLRWYVQFGNSSALHGLELKRETLMQKKEAAGRDAASTAEYMRKMRSFNSGGDFK